VAAVLTLAVVEPFSSGLGGGGFALVRMDGRLHFLDFRETAPANVDPHKYEGDANATRTRDGATAVAVPGAVAGLFESQKRFGHPSLKRVFDEAIARAHQGFPVDERYRRMAAGRLDQLRADPEAARIFLRSNEVPAIGDVLVQRDLEATLKALQQGPAVFYGGPLGQRIVKFVQAGGGSLTLDDLRAYKVVERDPLVGTYRNHAIVTAPPPSAGGLALLEILGLLDALPAETPWHDPGALHLYVEAMRQAFADRNLVGDPLFVQIPVPALLAPDRLLRLRARITDHALAPDLVVPGALTQTSPAAPLPDGGGNTTHLCVVDKDGNAVSLTTTLNYAFGAAVVVPGTGILLNDEMDDFSRGAGVPNVYGVAGAAANAIGPGRRPVSSMAPTMVFETGLDSPLRLVLGAPGGPRIPTQIAQGLWNFYQWGRDIQGALAAPRLHDQREPDRLLVERFGFDPATLAELRRRGWDVVEQDPWGNAVGIALAPDGVRTGAADPRWLGTALAQ
jgi:gamma-glutamyltranspeptidase/glutathione hydrolase